MGDVEDPAKPTGVARQQGWLGSLLSRRGSGSQKLGGASSAPETNRFKRFSAITEESQTHRNSSLNSGEWRSESPTSSKAAASAAAGGVFSLSRRAQLPKQADPLGLLQASSNLGRSTGISNRSMPATNSVSASSARSSRTSALKQRALGALGDVVIGRPSTAVKVSEEATKRYMNMAEEDIEGNLSTSRHLWDRGVIHPLDRRYRIWWYITVIAAAITGWLVPFRIAYLKVGYDTDQIEGATVLEIALLSLFCVDIVVSFFVAYYDHQGLLVVHRKDVALHYLRGRFVLDLITTIPLDAIVLTATGANHTSNYGRYLGLLGWLKIGRLYRVAVMFRHMSYNLNFGLLALTITRNLTFSFFLLHWAACSFWFIAVQEGTHAQTWVSQEQDVIGGRSIIELYVFSFYWAIVTFATLGYGDVTPSTTAEILFTICYIAINLIVWAYILGTITLLVTKQDEETGAYRARMSALTKYCTANNLSPDLKHTMAGLLRLHMSLQNETLDDEQVLAVYPTTIRRKILRQLYAIPMHECYLFDKCGVKFLDALMLGARVELFLPKVEIVSVLDHVNELYIVMAGHVELVPPSRLVNSDNSSSSTAALSAAPTTYGPGGDSLVDDSKPYRAVTIRSGADTNLVPPVAAPDAQAGPRSWAFGGAAHSPITQESLPGTTTFLPRLSADLSRPSPANNHQTHRRSFDTVLDALPGFRQMQRWLANSGIASDAWRRQQEQLQQDKQSLARISRVAALSRVSQLPGGRISGARADGMSTIAMRKLDTRSRAPLNYPSTGSSTSDNAGSAPIYAQDPSPGFEPTNPILGPGDCFAEVAYFTEVPKAEAVRSLTVCRVLVIPRSTYNAVSRDFPLSARQVLESLKNRAAQMVAEFMSPELAAQYLAHADDLTCPTATAAKVTQNITQNITQIEDMGTTAWTHGQGQSPFVTHQQQQQGSSAVDQQQQQQQTDRSKIDLRSKSDLRSASDAAAAVGVSPIKTGNRDHRDHDKPVLSSMSVGLYGRYNTYNTSNTSNTSNTPVSPGSPASSAAAAAGDTADRQTRALTRFTMNHSASTRWGTAGAPAAAAAAAAGSHRDPHRLLGSISADAAAAASRRRSSLDNPSATAAAAADLESSNADLGGRTSSLGISMTPGFSPGAKAGFRSLSGARSLGTMSMLPAVGSAQVARALEGMSHDPIPQRQQQQQRTLHSSSADPTLGSAHTDGGSNSNNCAAVPHGSSSSGVDSSDQRHPKIAITSESRSDPFQGFYSDEQLQAAAAAAAERLTLQQQSMLFDLLKIRQLVNKAAAKFDQQRLTAFLDAAAAGEVDVVQDMLRQGMSPNTADYDGRTALMIAAYRGHKDVVLNLLFVGADTTLKDARGFDVMIEAARGGHTDVLEVLTRSGARTGISDVLQSQLLCKATFEGKLDRLSSLLKAGCRPDSQDYDGSTPLHVAAAEGNLAAARLLVAAGGSPTLKDRWRYSALDLAHKVGAAPLVEYFESVVSADDVAAAAAGWRQERTEAALAAASWELVGVCCLGISFLYGDVPALQKLIDRGCPVDATDYDGRTLLHVAVTNKQGSIVTYLLSIGANANATNSTGSSPLLEAAMNGSSDIQAQLMAASARLNLPSTEEAALLSSVLHQGRHDQLLALLRAGADPAAADYDSRTPLHIAASVGDVEALKLLAAAVADTSIERLTQVNWAATDRWGDTPLQEAARAGHEEAVAFLQDMEQQQQLGQDSRGRIVGGSGRESSGTRQVAVAGTQRQGSRTFHNLKH